MCKYKHSLTKTSSIVALLNGTNGGFVDYKYWKCGQLYFYSCPAMGNSLSVTKKVNDFQYRKKTLNSIKVNRQRPKFVMRRPELKIPTPAKWIVAPSVRVIIKICIPWFPLSQLRPPQRPISSQNKAISAKDAAQPYNRFVFVSWSWRLPFNGNQALKAPRAEDQQQH